MNGSFGNVLKLTLLNILFILSANSATLMLVPNDNVVDCNEEHFLILYTEIGDKQASLKGLMEAELAKVNCFPMSNKCDHVVMSKLVTQFQLDSQKLKADYDKAVERSGCNLEKVKLKGATVNDPKSKSVVRADTEAKFQSIEAKNGETDDGWLKVGIKLHNNPAMVDGCKNNFYVQKTCHGEEGKIPTACGTYECREGGFNPSTSNNPASCVKFQCGGSWASTYEPKCSKVFVGTAFTEKPPICRHSIEDWNDLKSCYPAYVQRDRDERCPEGCDGTPNYHICDWNIDEKRKFSACIKSMLAIITMQQVCPIGTQKSDVDENGPPPRVYVYGYSQFTLPSGEKRIPITSSLGGNIEVQVYSIKGNQASMCITNEDAPTACDDPSTFEVFLTGTSRREIQLSNRLKDETKNWKITIHNMTTGKSTTKSFKTISKADRLSGVEAICNYSQEVFPAAGSSSATTFTPRELFQSISTEPTAGATCDCSANQAVKSPSGKYYECKRVGTNTGSAGCSVFDYPFGSPYPRHRIDHTLAIGESLDRSIRGRHETEDCTKGDGTPGTKVTSWYSEQKVRCDFTDFRGYKLTAVSGQSSRKGPVVIVDTCTAGFVSPIPNSGNGSSGGTTTSGGGSTVAGCEVYNWPEGASPSASVGPLPVGQKIKRDLKGTKVKQACPNGSDHFIRNYVRQEVKCEKADVPGTSGLIEVGTNEEKTVDVTSCSTNSTPTTSGGCVYYDWPGGKAPANTSGSLSIGGFANRSLLGKVIKPGCPANQIGIKTVFEYYNQKIKCNKDDGGAPGSGLIEVSRSRQTQEIGSTCREPGTSIE